jgi:hypothetical protein
MKDSVNQPENQASDLRSALRDIYRRACQLTGEPHVYVSSSYEGKEDCASDWFIRSPQHDFCGSGQTPELALADFKSVFAKKRPAIVEAIKTQADHLGFDLVPKDGKEAA